jgi:hypothetical protein
MKVHKYERVPVDPRDPPKKTWATASLVQMQEHLESFQRKQFGKSIRQRDAYDGDMTGSEYDDAENINGGNPYMNTITGQDGEAILNKPEA